MWTQFSTVINGALNKVTLNKSGPDSVSAVMEIWHAGADLSGPASSSNTIALTGVKASGDGTLLTANGPSVLWFHPTVAITLSAVTTDGGPKVHKVRVDVEGAGPEDTDTTNPISEADYDSAIAWSKAAKFPPMGPS